MQQIVSPEELQRQCLRWRAEGLRVALVPTMGYFHAGHETLMQRARKLADRVVVSLFVNPSQFGPNEDLDTYPRDLENDARVAERNGADLLFTPTPEGMYPAGYGTWVNVPALEGVLCGASRPGHFTGVCTVVLKLFMLACPHVAVFGEKDRQQLIIIRRMVKDLNLPLEIDGAPIVREADGLALSSRNKYLAPEERAVAPHLSKGLALGAELAAKGEKSAAVILEAVRAYHRANLPQGREDYLAIVDPETLQPLEKLGNGAILAVAMRLGGARLIDNLLI